MKMLAFYLIIQIKPDYMLFQTEGFIEVQASELLEDNSQAK